jgi:hypothetical protein
MKLARRILALLLLAALPVAGATSLGPAVMPSPKAAPATSFRAPAAFTSAVDLGAPDPGAIEALRAANARSDSKRLEVGIGRGLPDTAAAGPTWTPAEGGMAARWRVRSAGAESLRVALYAADWPAEAEVRFAGNADAVVYGPYSGAQARTAGAVFWSPVLEGDIATVEVFVPRDSKLPEPWISRVSHLFVSFAAPRADIVAKVAEPCQVNIVCRAATEPALDEAGRAVARIAFTTAGGGSAFCTGTLLNSASGGLTPYFATAGHCISAPSEAASVTTRWFYETASCSGTALNTADTQVAGGATLLYANTTEDFTLVRLNGTPPGGAVFSGWDSARLDPGSPATGIHHPTGDVKKVSLGTTAGVGKSVVADGNGFRIQWTGTSTGFTEPGSSGSGIFSGNASAGYRFRGTLQGGPIVTCSAPVSQLYDYYSRFDLNFPFIAQYLSPAAAPALGANALANPGFESGNASWSESSAAGAIVTNDASIARSGSWYAWLGGANSLTDSLTTTLTVPAGTARLRFWYRISTAETAGAQFDVLTFSIVDAGSGATLRDLGTLSNLDSTGGWAESPVYDVSAFGNRSVRLRFRSTSDSSLVTSFRIDDIAINGTALTGAAAANQTALWWNPAESGWGINVTQQGDIAFATLFTYASNGAPMWLVMSGGTRQQGSATFMGPLYRTTGPPFNANPFTPIGPGNITEVGTLTVDFNGATPLLAYEVGDPYVSKTITKQVFGVAPANCLATTGSRASATNYQDLWWNPAESGWGINLTHQGDVIFATLFTYAADGQGLWLVMSAGRRQGDGSYLGELYRTTGPAFNAVPFTPIGPGNITQVGTMRLRFSNGENGTLEYSVDGVNVTKAITRQVFSSPVPLCTG